MKRVMWIEHKEGDGLVGPARIGWVHVQQKGKRLDYRGQSFRTLDGRGFKANYYDVATGDEYWISGCRRDGRDALYATEAEIDEDALAEYWVNIRRLPENIRITRLRVPGKH
jgi:hypothetical protein